MRPERLSYTTIDMSVAGPSRDDDDPTPMGDEDLVQSICDIAEVAKIRRMELRELKTFLDERNVAWRTAWLSEASKHPNMAQKQVLQDLAVQIYRQQLQLARTSSDSQRRSSNSRHSRHISPRTCSMRTRNGSLQDGRRQLQHRSRHLLDRRCL